MVWPIMHFIVKDLLAVMSLTEHHNSSPLDMNAV